ncbi:MAG: RluA family pseudouridine synthase [Candidatus Rokubacteria bacterium]|nr:RluA family pseudouridine synthase [Candidatus Rokubacteria bacterium]
MRLDRFLSSRLPELSRTRLQVLIDGGHVRVDGVGRRASHRLRGGEEVWVEVPAPTPLELTSEPIPLDIVYEDEVLLVVNKPPGMVVHPGAGHDRGTLVHALLAHCPTLSGIGGVRRPGIVHRLDKGTSGLLVVAKTDRAHLELARQLQARTVSRRYLALVHGGPAPEAGVIEAAIGRHPRDRVRMAVRPAGQGRAALTRFRVLERFEGLTLLEARLQTGRTHQIRVHLAHLGFPVAGDPVYRRRSVRPPDGELAARLAALGGLALHAAALGFTHPVSGTPLEFEVPPPAPFAALLDWLRRRRARDAGGSGVVL